MVQLSPEPAHNGLDGDLDQGPFRTAEAEPMAIEDIRDALVVRDNGIFLLTDKSGNVPAGNESGFGLYFADTRFLSAFQLAFGTVRPVLLHSSAADGFASTQVLTNPTLTDREGSTIPRETIELLRERHIDHQLVERLQVTNFGSVPAALTLSLRFGADFADILEVRGAARSGRGRRHHPVIDERAVSFSYTAEDGAALTCRLAFSEKPESIDPRSASFAMRLEPGARSVLIVTVEPRLLRSGATAEVQLPWPASRRVKASDLSRWKEDGTSFLTANPIFNAIIDQSLTDLRTLWNHVDSGGGFLAAGTPWFDTLFGRDSLVAGLQTLAFKPEIARAALYTLGLLQGTENNEFRDEQRGKILHESRHGEMSRMNEVPFGRYYGSIDSTPLFMFTAGEYWRWTGDLEFARWLWPRLLECWEWMKRDGDRDGDGYLEYERRSEKGLLNQGWKDSANAIVHVDGELSNYPIALVEVQGYVYAGQLGMAEIGDALGEHRVAHRLRAEARALRRRFNRDFWMADAGYYALALDGSKQQVRSITSNPGHALFAGIVPRARAAAVASQLIDGPLFSGWGIRTLSADSVRFNPMGYHTGSVWPHDNAIAAAGLRRYGLESALHDLATALYDTARTMEYYRLPELFCGSDRVAGGQPVPYPVACRPQAWAAGTMPLLLTSLLGLEADAPAGVLRVVRAKLPYWLDSVDVTNLRVGTGSVDLHFEIHGRRTRVTKRQEHGVRVEIVQPNEE